MLSHGHTYVNASASGRAVSVADQQIQQSTGHGDTGHQRVAGERERDHEIEQCLTDGDIRLYFAVSTCKTFGWYNGNSSRKL